MEKRRIRVGSVENIKVVTSGITPDKTKNMVISQVNWETLYFFRRNRK